MVRPVFALKWVGRGEQRRMMARCELESERCVPDPIVGLYPVTAIASGSAVQPRFLPRGTRFSLYQMLTGGHVGSPDLGLKYEHCLAGTRVLFNSRNPDPHVPSSHLEASAREPGRIGAQVELVRHAHRLQTMVERELVAARFLELYPALSLVSLVVQWDETLSSLWRNVWRTVASVPQQFRTTES